MGAPLLHLNPPLMVDALASEVSSMTTGSKCRTRFSIGFALCACLASWFIVGESSPLAGYFLTHVEIPNLWYALHTIPYLLGLLLPSNVFTELVIDAAIFLQWLLIGYLLARLFCKGEVK